MDGKAIAAYLAHLNSGDIHVIFQNNQDIIDDILQWHVEYNRPPITEEEVYRYRQQHSDKPREELEEVVIVAILEKERKLKKIIDITPLKESEVDYLLYIYVRNIVEKDENLVNSVTINLGRTRVRSSLDEEIKKIIPSICEQIANKRFQINFSKTPSIQNLASLMITQSLCNAFVGIEEGSYLYPFLEKQKQNVLSVLQETDTFTYGRRK